MEEKRDFEELSKLAKEGKPLYGVTTQPEYMQGVAHRNSVWSQLKFGTLPWCVALLLVCRRKRADAAADLDRFNFVAHNHHSPDPSKYYPKTADSE